MLHKTSLERYGKLKRTFQRLMRDFNRHDLDDFIATANSLREWIRRDGSLSEEQRNHLERFIVPESLDWQMCNEIANTQKHVNKLDTHGGKKPLVKAVYVRPGGRGFAVPPTMRIMGAGEEITFDCHDRQESALAFVVRTFKHFHYIFEIAPVPINSRDISVLTDIFRFV